MTKSTLKATEYFRSIPAVMLFFLIFLIAISFILLLLIISVGKVTNFIIGSIAPSWYN